MNKLWNLEHFSAEALHRTVVRDGLRIRIHPQVHPFLRREVHTFVRWLRANYPFPIRVNGLHPEHEENPRERRRFVLRALLCAG